MRVNSCVAIALYACVSAASLANALPIVPGGGALAAQSQSAATAAADLRVKQQVLDRITAAKDVLTLHPDHLAHKDPSWLGQNVENWPVDWKRELVRRYREARADPAIYVPWDDVRGLSGEALDHEAIEADEWIFRQVFVKVASLLGELGKLITLVGSDARELAVAAVQMIVDAMKKPDVVTPDNVAELLAKYAPDVDKLGSAQRQTLVRRIQSQLTAEIAKETRAASRSKGPQAHSRSGGSIAYDAHGRLLSFGDDLISGFVPSGYTDPLTLGAAVTLPNYVYEGLTSWGGGLPLFVPALDDSPLLVQRGALRLFTADLPSLVYFRDTNSFQAVLPFVMPEVSAPFARDVRDLWLQRDDDWPAFLSLSLVPDIDFYADTLGFAADSGPGIGFTNRIGLIAAVPEPSSMALLLLALGLLGARARPRSETGGQARATMRDVGAGLAAHGRAVHTSTVRTAIHSRFMTPPTNSSSISVQQQPTQ